MYLYSLTLQKPTGISNAIYGNFMGTKEQEIVVGRGKILEIMRIDANGKLQSLYSVEIFGVIRSLVQFRLTGSQKDLIIVGSDSGRIVILEFNVEKNIFDKIHQETFGKSGCRRIVPGQYLAVDPKGRACLIGACEKQKLVYVLNRDNAARLTISSPLEAHKSHTIVYSIVGVDCGFDNPIFAAIELDYAEADQDSSGVAAVEAEKMLTFYELDLGLNHVVRKSAFKVDNGSNLLVQVPGGGDGPSGVLICAENFLIYRNQNTSLDTLKMVPDIRALIPRRFDLPAARGVLIVTTATHRSKKGFFFLLQTEYGDIFKVTLEYDKQSDTVTLMTLTYFDTIPVCSALCVLKSGLLFAAAEFGNHHLYRFTALGDDADVVSTSDNIEETEDGFKPIFFHPRKLKNLELIDDVESLMPILDMKIANLFDEETPQIFALCGRGARTSLRILKTGLAVQEMAVSALPGEPTAVWTVKKKVTDEFDQYIVVSFLNVTLVLSIGETVEEVNDSGFLDTTPTLAASLLGEDSLMQVHPGGIRHIRVDGRINEWKTPGKKTIVKVGCNRLQVAIALSGGELFYFEMDATGQLTEIEKKDMAGDVACLDIAPVPEGRQRSRFLAVGSFDSTIRILSLDPDDCMQVLSVQAVSSVPESLLLLEIVASYGGEDGADRPASMFLNAGLTNGVLLRTEVDMLTGQLSDTRTRFLGGSAPKLFSCSVREKRAVLCLSSRPWLGYSLQGHFQLTPLSYEKLAFASSFSSDQCPEGVVAVAGNNLRVFTIERLGESFNQTVIPLRYTPRKFVLNPTHKTLVILESHQGAFTAKELEENRAEALRAAEPQEEEEEGGDEGRGEGERVQADGVDGEVQVEENGERTNLREGAEGEDAEDAAAGVAAGVEGGEGEASGDGERASKKARRGEASEEASEEGAKEPVEVKKEAVESTGNGAVNGAEDGHGREVQAASGGAQDTEMGGVGDGLPKSSGNGGKGDGDTTMAEDGGATGEGDGEGEEGEEPEDPLPMEQFGFPKQTPDKWASCIRVLDPVKQTTTCLLELLHSEAALTICLAPFPTKAAAAAPPDGGSANTEGPLLVIGTAKELQFWPKRETQGGFIHVYRMVEEGRKLELVHKTPIDGIPTALCAFQGRLLVGVGNVLRIYELGKRKLLRKCENKSFPNTIVSIHTYGDRIYVGDMQESFHYVKYRPSENQLYIFADDVSPRWLSSSLHIDFDTMAGADKFGNIYFVRLPAETSEEIEEDPTGGKIRWEAGKLNGAPFKVEEVIQFHVGDVVTTMQRASLIQGGGESLLFGTIMGSIGALLPFTSREDVDFFSHLEMHLRQEHPPLCGRDHMMYRSSYFPVKDVIDGDLCEQFPSLPLDMQKKIGEELDRTPGEIMKKLEDIRNRIL